MLFIIEIPQQFDHRISLAKVNSSHRRFDVFVCVCVVCKQDREDFQYNENDFGSEHCLSYASYYI